MRMWRHSQDLSPGLATRSLAQTLRQLGSRSHDNGIAVSRVFWLLNLGSFSQAGIFLKMKLYLLFS